MSRIDEAIRAAQAELTAAQALPDTDDSKATKVAAAQAKVSALQSQKQAIEDEINDAVRNRLPDAESTAKQNERKAVAAALGIPVDQLTDEKLAEVKQAYQGQQSEVDRERQAREAAEQRATSLETSEQKAKRIAEAARTQLQETLKRQAVERALLAEGVIHQTGEGDDKKSYLDGAYRLTDLSQVNVEVKVDDEGNLKVEGEVQGAADAAKKTKESYPAMFGEAHTVENPPGTPPGKGGGNGGGSGDLGYTGNYNIPVKS